VLYTLITWQPSRTAKGRREGEKRREKSNYFKKGERRLESVSRAKNPLMVGPASAATAGKAPLDH
jgi:hypothetical protein